jgi:hypothetical protein
MKKVYQFLSGSQSVSFNSNMTTNETDIEYLLEPPKEYKVTKYESQLLNVLRQWKPKNTLTLLNTCLGLEIEIEGISNIPKSESFKSYWSVTNDGSLRNGGKEFITQRGFRFHQLKDAFSAFKRSVLDSNLTYEFTERCSTHVHVDVRSFTEAQLQNLIACYAIVERGLFSFCEATRQENIFCIPITETTYLVDNLSADMFDRCGSWEKYTALNLAPVLNFGTVEFRQLHGSASYYEWLTWCLLVTNLVTYCRLTPTKDIIELIKNLKYKSQYEMFIQELFGGLSSLMTWDYEHMDEVATLAKLNLPKFEGEDTKCAA